MKHIQLFEGWEQGDLVGEVTPYLFGKFVDHHIAKGTTEAGARQLNMMIKDNPDLLKDKVTQDHLRRFTNHLNMDQPELTSTPKEPQMSLEDWKALIQGLSALPGDLGVDLGSNVLARAMEAMPEIKTNTDYKKELVKFTEMSKTRLGLDENESSIGMTPTRNPFRNEMDQIKELPAYRDLLAMGFIDVSTPQGLAQGNIRFAPAVPDLNSTIRINLNGSVWHDLSSGKTVRIDRLDPITTIEDYGDRISMVPDFIRG